MHINMIFYYLFVDEKKSKQKSMESVDFDRRLVLLVVIEIYIAADEYSWPNDKLKTHTNTYTAMHTAVFVGSLRCACLQRSERCFKPFSLGLCECVGAKKKSIGQLIKTKT